MSEKPSYYAIIPANVRYDTNLTADEKLLFCEITALTESTGQCWASNSYFADLYQVTPITISRRISNLKQHGYIDTFIQYKPNSKEIDKRIITLKGIDSSDKGYCFERQGGINTNDNRGIASNVKENNTSDYQYKSNKNISPISPLEEMFAIFWEKYPKKVNKEQAKKSFNKVVDKNTFDLILADLEKRKGYIEWTKNDGQYIPNPSTYLNNARWTDVYKTTNRINFVDYNESVQVSETREQDLEDIKEFLKL